MVDDIRALELGEVRKREFFLGFARTLTIRTPTGDVQLILSAEGPELLELQPEVVREPGSGWTRVEPTKETNDGQRTDDTAADSWNGRGDAKGTAPAAAHDDTRPRDAGD